MRLRSALLATVALTTLGGTAIAQQTPPNPVPSVTVVGNGEVRVEPDLATVRLGIQVQAQTAQDAQSQASATAQKILNAVVKVGVDRKDIQTGSLSLYPVYNDGRPNQTAPPEVVAYRAQNTVTIRVLDLKKVGAVVDATVAAGANEIQGIEFGLINDEAARRQALQLAARAARTKAEAIASALGVKLGSILEIVEGNDQVVPVRMARLEMMNGAPANAPVEPGQIGVSANVTVRFRVE